MINVHSDGTSSDHGLGIDEDLLDIACRGSDSAFVVGARGTFLRTFDGGVEWESVDVGTRGALRSVAAASREYVVVAGDEGLFLSADSGTTWSRLEKGAFTSVAIDQTGDVIMALDGVGTVWREDRRAALRQVLATTATTTATSLAMSPDGERAVVIAPGDTLQVFDAHAGWQPLELGAKLDLHRAWITQAGDIVAVGIGGAVVRVDEERHIEIQYPLLSDLDAIHLGSNVGYAGGQDGHLMLTYDGGVSWNDVGHLAPRRILGIGRIDPLGRY